jgi:hypothetical protein
MQRESLHFCILDAQARFELEDCMVGQDMQVRIRPVVETAQKRRPEPIISLFRRALRRFVIGPVLMASRQKPLVLRRTFRLCPGAEQRSGCSRHMRGRGFGELVLCAHA